MPNDPEHDALYSAVCAAPEDDDVRLVFADWLDEHADRHRAEYIRAEVALARQREADPHSTAVLSFFGTAGHGDWSSFIREDDLSPDVARLSELITKAVAHRKKAETRWKAVLGKCKAGRIYTYRRGFPYGIAISNARQFAKAAAKEPDENLPGYSLFVMSGNESGFDEFLSCGRLAGARGVSLFGIHSPEVVRALGRRPEVRNFKELYLNLEVADPAIVAAVAEEPNWSGLARLELLDLGDCPIGVEGAKTLAGCGALKKMRRLVVSRNEKYIPADRLQFLQEKFGKRLHRR